MLQQILRDMRVAPEILAELDETQKQTLFCRMREEQVRRWRLWDQKLSKDEDEGPVKKKSLGKNNRPKKKVNFLMGKDGEPWVWVMGEHPNDKTIDQIMEEEAREKARKQALKETEQLRKSVERELSLIHFTSPPINDIEKDIIMPKESEKIVDNVVDIYCSVDDLREKMKNMAPIIKDDINENKEKDPVESLDVKINNQINQNHNHNHNRNSNYKNNITNFNFIEGRRDVLQEINLNKNQKVSARVALWEKRVTEERAVEILRGLKNRQALVIKEAEETAISHHLLWQEQEKKAKEAEYQMREIARRAREEHRKSFICDNNTKESPSPSIESGDLCYTDPILNIANELKPPSRDAIIEWFMKQEITRGAGKDELGNPAKWFHGLITRNEAESLLQECSVGSYLVRVSERIWGYAISYRGTERCKHYLIDASQISHYQFLGANQVAHKSLANLITYHSKNVITEAGKEMLLKACEVAMTPNIMITLKS